MIEFLMVLLLTPIISVVWFMSVCLTITIYQAYKNGEL